MNVKRMLADFLRFVTPKTMHKARFSVLLDAVTALAKDARCTVTAIGRAMPGSSDKVSIKCADRLLSNSNLQRELPLIYAAMTRSIVSSKSQPLILVDFHYLMGAAGEIAGVHLRYKANTIKNRRVLVLNFLGILLCNESKIPIRRNDYQQGLKQILHWVAQWDWAQIKLAKS